MRDTVSYHLAVGALVVGAIFSWPTNGAAQTLAGEASAVRATVGGLFGSTTTTLAGTGSLSGPMDAREASQLQGSVPALLSGETLHATTIGWPDQVASEASIARLALSVAGNSIGASSILARATAVESTGAAAVSNVDGLSINGVSVPVSGDPNQTVSIPGGRVVINEQSTSGGGIVVNALHVVVFGVADVVVASASAAIQ